MSPMSTPTTSPVAIGALIFRCNDTGTTRRIVPAESWDDIPDGWFVTEDAVGYRTYARFTGRTRKFWGLDCPTIDRYDIETIATPDGVIMGVPGERLAGRAATWATRPENVC